MSVVLLIVKVLWSSLAVKAHSTIGVDRDVATSLEGARAAEKEQLELQLHCMPFNLYSLLGMGL